MEQKTIGKFISALRKANGLTQKDLAEKLNVSDKTVSRWERDEGAPDLSVIPVIAEIFGVTCDELLRGERKPEAERSSEEPTVKGEKQRQRILNVSLSRYRTQSLISIGISTVGLIAAMIGNLGFIRGYIGFFVGAIFYVASLVCQAIFVNSAFLSISDGDLAGEEIERFKTSVIDFARKSACITLTLFGATLPLIIFPYDTYSGLELTSWILSGLVFGALTRLLCGVIWYFIHASLLKKGVCTLSEQAEIIFWHNHKLKRKCFLVFAVIIAAVFAVQFVFNEVWGAWDLAGGTEFYDYGSFVEFMEQSVPYQYESAEGGYVAAEPLDSVYYDEYGNEITEEEAFREELRIADGSPEGKVVCTFIRRNNSVVSWSAADSEDGLPITIRTQADYAAAAAKVNLINIGFAAVYVLGILGTVLAYRKKRVK